MIGEHHSVVMVSSNHWLRPSTIIMTIVIMTIATSYATGVTIVLLTVMVLVLVGSILLVIVAGFTTLALKPLVILGHNPLTARKCWVSKALAGFGPFMVRHSGS